MRSKMRLLAFFAFLVCATPHFAAAQDSPTAGEDGSSEQVEESDEAFRRRMELEDARRRDPGYTTPVGSQQKDQEKIDKLPPESRDNIRDQLVDIIMENGEWEPSDALEAYPYEPTGAAREDPELMEQEQEAWDEQIAKYHEREAAAFGAYRSPPASPGATAGQEAASGAGSNQAGQVGPSGQGGKAGQSGAAGSYSPYAVDRETDEDEISTAGAQQSALDFLRGGRGQTAAPTDPVVAGTDTAASEAVVARGAAGSAEPGMTEEADGNPDAAEDVPGIIAIEDLDKLEGTENPDDSGPSDTPR